MFDIFSFFLLLFLSMRYRLYVKQRKFSLSDSGEGAGGGATYVTVVHRDVVPADRAGRGVVAGDARAVVVQLHSTVSIQREPLTN